MGENDVHVEYLTSENIDRAKEILLRDKVEFPPDIYLTREDYDDFVKRGGDLFSRLKLRVKIWGVDG